MGSIPGGPEFGVTHKGPPEDADEYDPSDLSHLPPDQRELAEKQREERRKAAEKAREEEEKELRKLGIDPAEAREAQERQRAASAPKPEEDEDEEVPDEEV